MDTGCEGRGVPDRQAGDGGQWDQGEEGADRGDPRVEGDVGEPRQLRLVLGAEQRPVQLVARDAQDGEDSGRDQHPQEPVRHAGWPGRGPRHGASSDEHRCDDDRERGGGHGEGGIAQEMDQG